MPNATIERMRRALAAHDADVDPHETIRSQPSGSATAMGSDTPAPATQVDGRAAHAGLPQLDVSDDASAQLRVIEKLGAGGMGEVMLARDRTLDREVAVKRLLSKHRGEAWAVDTLLHEGIVTGRLEHPNIVPVHALGIDPGGSPAIVMKRVEGVPWHALIADGEHDHRHFDIFLEVCRAIEFAHSRGIVHRDIKPSNVLVGSYGEVYVGDWGIATDSGTGAYDHRVADEDVMPLGTPGYMAPEMLKLDGVIDHKTDVYLLGATLHHVLVGRSRHGGGESLLDAFSSVATSEPYDYAASVPRRLAAICNKAMSWRKKARFSDVGALRKEVSRYLRHRASIALADEAAQRLRELKAITDAPDSDDRLTTMHRVFSAARFGYEQALREWDGNREARAGLSRALAIMVRQSIDSGDVATAEAFAAELTTPEPALLADLERAKAAQGDEKARAAQLERFARDLDPQHRWRPRFLFFVIVGLVGAALALSFTPVLGAQLLSLTYPNALIMQAFIALVFGVAVALGRHTLLVDTVTRRVIAMLALVMLAMFVNRLLCWANDTSFAQATANEMLLSCLATSIAAITVDRRLLWGAVCFAVGTAAAHLFPARFLEVFVTSTVLAFLSVSLGLGPGRRSLAAALTLLLLLGCGADDSSRGSAAGGAAQGGAGERGGGAQGGAQGRRWGTGWRGHRRRRR